MKRKHHNMRDEYPAELIRSGVRGRHDRRFGEGTNVVRIDPDLHDIFPGSEAVKRALRGYLEQNR